MSDIQLNEDYDCEICGENLDNEIVLLECGDMFHYDCLKKFKTRNDKCPVCKKQIKIFIKGEFKKLIDIIPKMRLILTQLQERQVLQKTQRYQYGEISGKYSQDTKKELSLEIYRQIVDEILKQVDIKISGLEKKTRNGVLNSLELVLSDIFIDKEEIIGLIALIKSDFDLGREKTVTYLKTLIKKWLLNFLEKLPNLTVTVVRQLLIGDIVDLTVISKLDLEIAEEYAAVIEELDDDYKQYLIVRCRLLDRSINGYLEAINKISQVYREKAKNLVLFKEFVEHTCDQFEASLSILKKLFPNAELSLFVDIDYFDYYQSDHDQQDQDQQQ